MCGSLLVALSKFGERSRNTMAARKSFLKIPISLAVVDATFDAAMEVEARVTSAVGITPQARPMFESFSDFVVNKLDGYLQDTLGAPAT